MSANITDKVTDVRNSARPVTASVTGTRNAGGTSLTCDALTGWPTASKVHFVTYTVDSNSDPVAGTQLDCSGIISGSTIGSLTVIDGNDTGNAVGDKVEMLPTAAWGQDLADALTNQHSRTGAHAAVNNTGGMTTDTLTVTSGTTLPAGDIGTNDLATGAVTSPKVAAGISVQTVAVNSSAFASLGTNLIPYDDTIPQITEGTECLTLAITPKASANRLFIEARIFLGNSVANDLIGALFQDATVDALAANAVYQSGPNGGVTLILTHDMAAGTTSSTTFRVRAGGNGAGTTYFNGPTASRKFGGITTSTIKIMEYKV